MIVKHFDSNKTMSFKVSDNKFLKNTLKHGGKLAVSCIQNLIVNLFMVTMMNT